MPQVTFTYVAFVLWMSCSSLSYAQPVEIDTIITSNVESNHFKIRLPKVANIESYKILFRNYGVFSELEIEGETQQFVGDYNNIQRTKTIDQKIKKQGIEPTLITFFRQPAIEIKEVAVSQQAITGELSNKSLAFSRKVMELPPNEYEIEVFEDALIEEKDDQALREEEKKETVDNTNEAIQTTEATKTDTDIEESTVKASYPDRPGVKNKPIEESNPETETINTKDNLAKMVDEKVEPFIPDNLPEKLPESGNYVLLLPLVDNPQVYQIVLRDLGHVRSVELTDGSLWYYFGFFDSAESASKFIPQLNERGFKKDMPVVQFEAVKQEAQLLYNDAQVPVETEVNQIEKEKPASSKTINLKGDYFRIELPKVSNPEIFFKAFEDVGNTYSEIAPNGEAIYYIGAYETTEAALEQLERLKPRGLSNASIIRFSGDHRINPYRNDQLKPKEDISKQLKNLFPEKKEPLIKTNPKGKYQIRLGQVDNPEVFKEVFGDIGKIKVGYFEDESEFFYLGNYYVKEDAEFVVKQLKERGLTQIKLINIQADTKLTEGDAVKVISIKEKPKITQPIADKVELSEKMEAAIVPKISEPIKEEPLVNRAETANIVDQSTKEITRYRILLGALDNPKIYQNILKEFGTITQEAKADATTLYYLESYHTLRVAQLVIEEIRALGIETPMEVVVFKP